MVRTAKLGVSPRSTSTSSPLDLHLNTSLSGPRAVEHYQNAMQAQREGNWARYGDEIRRLGDVLEKMRPQ
jgi:uncharacterized membrane protein (UPF0182 family)